MSKKKLSLKSVNSNTLVLMGVIVFAKLLGMLREVFLANYYGTSGISDAYLIASSVPTLLFYFIGHALSTSFLPMYNKVKEEKGEDEANRYANNLLTVSLLICTLIVAVLLAFPGVVVKLFAAGFVDETAALAAYFIRICAVSLYFMTVVSVWSGYLQAKNSFIIPAIVSVPRNLIVIASIVLGVILGTLLGELLRIDDGIEGAGDFIKKKVFRGRCENSRFTEAFVTASVVFCVGSMTITGLPCFWQTS